MSVVLVLNLLTCVLLTAAAVLQFLNLRMMFRRPPKPPPDPTNQLARFTPEGFVLGSRIEAIMPPDEWIREQYPCTCGSDDPRFITHAPDCTRRVEFIHHLVAVADSVGLDMGDRDDEFRAKAVLFLSAAYREVTQS